MTKKHIRNNINILRNIRDRHVGKVPAPIQQRINIITSLYEDRKISQFGTAERLIKNITTKNDKQKAKGIKEADKSIQKYESATPITEKLAKNAEKARETKKVSNVKVRLREKTKASAVSRLVRKAKERGFGKTHTYSVSYMLFTSFDDDSNYNKNNEMGRRALRQAFTVNGLKYFPINPKEGHRTANIKTTPFIETVVRKKITTQKETRALFKKLMSLLSRDTNSNLYGYIHAIVVYSVSKIDNADDEAIDVEEEGLRETKNVSIYNYYHETLIDPTRETVEEAIKNKDYRENECWINALLEKYEGTKLTKEKRGSLAKPALTRNKILEMLNRTEDDIHKYGISINQMKPIFKFFSIPVKLYNCECQLLFQYIPDNYKNNRHTQIFTGMIKNNHIYPINANWDRLNHLDVSDPKELKVSSNFYINDMDEPPTYKIFSHIDELLKLTEDDRYNLIHVDNNLNEVLFQLKGAGYEPFVRYQANKISQLRVRFKYRDLYKSVDYIISSQDLSKDYIERDVLVNTEDKYNRLINAMFQFNKSIFSESHKSKYDDIDMSILNECKTVVPQGWFHKMDSIKNHAEIDRTKAFTWAFRQIKRIPKFNEFDAWMPMTDEIDIYKLSSLTLYMVEVYEGNIFFNKKINIIYGKFLRKLLEDNVKLKIIYYKQPSHIHKVDYDKVVGELWDTYISDDKDEDKQIKKKIANINFGMLEKSVNTGQRSKIFNSIKEACHHQRIHGGKIYAIQKETYEVEYLGESDSEEDFNEKTTMGDTYYILNTTCKRHLVNGFIYIKELLLQYHNFAMYDAYTKLKNNNIKIYSVKSDAFTIHIDDLSKVMGNPNCPVRALRQGILTFGDEIGVWRLSQSQITCPTEKYRYKFNEIKEIPIHENHQVEVVDEWDTKAICHQIIENNPCMIRAKYAGSGKSYIAQYFYKLGYNVLSVVPHNRLSQEVIGHATTLNMFFRIPVNKGDELPPFDHSDFDVIVFDEIFMSNEFIYSKILAFVRDNPDKIIIGAGDTKQLPCISDLTNTQPHDQYADKCIDRIFKNNIYLKVCKRIGEKDRTTLDNLYDDYWVKKLPIAEIIEKYFRYTKTLKPNHMHIAYTNSRCKMVSDEVRKKLGKVGLYEVGEELICRIYYKNWGTKFNVNIRYKIININSDLITIQNIKTRQTYDVYEAILYKHFRYGYCATCHSCQGASIKNHITIHEWNKTHLVSREWIWTALTRCVDFNNVYFFRNDDADDRMEHNQFINYLKNKVDGYKQQDLRAGRDLNLDNYVDVEWCMERMRGTCGKCGCDFHIEKKKGFMSSNFTAQRLDNNFSHTKDNCQAFCVYCNCSSK